LPVSEYSVFYPCLAKQLLDAMGSLLADQQNKHSNSYQQGKQSTDGERESPVPSIWRLRSSAFLRRSDP
jgi:hypothetical protein